MTAEDITVSPEETVTITVGGTEVSFHHNEDGTWTDRVISSNHPLRALSPAKTMHLLESKLKACHLADWETITSELRQAVCANHPMRVTEVLEPFDDAHGTELTTVFLDEFSNLLHMNPLVANAIVTARKALS